MHRCGRPLPERRRGPAAVPRDVHRDAAAQPVVAVHVENERVGVNGVVWPERDDGVARALERAALVREGREFRQLAVSPRRPRVEARRVAVGGVAAVGDPALLVGDDDVARIRRIHRDRRLDLGVRLDVLLYVGRLGLARTEVVDPGPHVAHERRNRVRRGSRLDGCEQRSRRDGGHQPPARESPACERRLPSGAAV